MTESYSERQIRASERILEDESLTEDLSDGPAQALITWASREAAQLAGDESRSDEELSNALKALRKAVRKVASSGEDDPDVLIAQAKQALTAALGDTAQTAPQAAASAQQAAPADSVAQTAPQAPPEPAKHHAKEGKAAATPPVAAAPVAQVSKPLDAKTTSAETPVSEQATSQASVAEAAPAQQAATDQTASQAPGAEAAPAQQAEAAQAPSQSTAQSAGKIDPASLQAQSEAALEALLKRSSAAETRKASSSEEDASSTSTSKHEASSSEPKHKRSAAGRVRALPTLAAQNLERRARLDQTGLAQRYCATHCHTVLATDHF